MQNAANLISEVPIVITVLKFKVPSKTQCNLLRPPVNQKTSYMLPPYQGTEYLFPFQKEGLVGIVRKYWTKARPKPAWYTRSCSSVSTKCFVSKALVGCPSSIAACNTDVILLCAAFGFPTTASVTGLLMALLQKVHLYYMFGLVKPRRKEESRSLSFFDACKASTM